MLAWEYTDMQPELALPLFSVAVLILSIVLHEVAHGYAAKALGDETAARAGRLTLNPLRHIDIMGSIIIPAFLVFTNSGILFGWAKPVPYNPYNLKNQRWGEAFVAIAGVATNITIAILFALIARGSMMFGLETFAFLSAIIVTTNLFLGFFNLLPIPPLDGYTVLRGLVPYKFSMYMRAFEERMQQGGIATLVIILFVFSYFLSGPFIGLVMQIARLLIGF